MELAKHVTYKYIGKDTMKKGYIAKQVIAGLNKYYKVGYKYGEQITMLDDSFVEEEPETRELLLSNNLIDGNK